MTTGMQNQKAAVDSGYWPLFRYQPRAGREGREPAQARLQGAQDPAQGVRLPGDAVQDADQEQAGGGGAAARAGAGGRACRAGSSTSRWRSCTTAQDERDRPEGSRRLTPVGREVAGGTASGEGNGKPWISARPTWVCSCKQPARSLGRSLRGEGGEPEVAGGRGRRGRRPALAFRGADPRTRNTSWCTAPRHGTESFAEALCYFPEPSEYRLGTEEYLHHIEACRSAPCASRSSPALNGMTPGGWTKYAKKMESAGADALELNIYFMADRPGGAGARRSRIAIWRSSARSRRR